MSATPPDPPSAAAPRLLDHVAGGWWAVRDVGRVMGATRASLLSVAIGGGLIALTDQARDIVIASAAGTGGFWDKVGFVVVTLFWAVSAWYWARITLSLKFALPAVSYPAPSGRAIKAVRAGGTDTLARKWAFRVAVAASLVALVAAMYFGRCLGWSLLVLATLCPGALWYGLGARADRPEAWRDWWSDNVPRLLGTAAIGSLAAAFWQAREVYEVADDPAAGAFVIWTFAYFALAVGFHGFTANRAALMAAIAGIGAAKKVPERLRRDLAVDGAGAARRLYDHPGEIESRLARVFLGGSLLLSPVMFGLFAWAPVGTAAAFGDAVRAVLFGLAILVAAVNALALASARYRFPVLGALIVWMAAGTIVFGDNHDVRLVRDDKGVAPPAPVRATLGEAYEAWWNANARITTPLWSSPAAGERAARSVSAPPLVVVATAGGASRAAFWTSQVLGEIAAREDHFAERLFLISGVSGGSLGAATFRSFVEAERRRGTAGPRMEGAAVRSAAFLRNDFLTPAMAVGLYVDLPLHVAPFLGRWWLPADRAAALERAWEEHAGGRVDHAGAKGFAWSGGFLAAFGARDRPWPILALNGTSVEKGKRIIASNVDFARSGMAGDVSRYDVFATLGADVPISTAATMSARFPIISPTGGLRDRGGVVRMRVTDGGLFENFGAATADDVLRYLVERRADAQAATRAAVPIAILISSDPSLDPLDATTNTGVWNGRLPPADCAPADGIVPAPTPHVGNGWPECPFEPRGAAAIGLDPLLALYGGRVARGELAATALQQRVVENVRSMRDRLTARVLAEAGKDIGAIDPDRTAETLRSLKDARWIVERDLKRRLGTHDHVDFFHFRQCRLDRKKGPTMSWHDSEAAWGAMESMLGIDPAKGDPCGNGAELFRLCVRLARLTGAAADDKEATLSCERREPPRRAWTKPDAWGCREVGEGGDRRWYCGVGAAR
ncbi:MAG: hypothetical protein IPK81_17620 [Rhodospirillales bacterium]|nr:MAG: hypothetical protein IPK81_17620 [Rhodospirillales bacterium]